MDKDIGTTRTRYCFKDGEVPCQRCGTVPAVWAYYPAGTVTIDGVTYKLPARYIRKLKAVEYHPPVRLYCNVCRRYLERNK
jgi:hypothetical protein